MTDPYREWRKADEAMRRYGKELARISRELDLLWDATTVTFSHELAENPHYRKVVRRFFGRSQRGWEVACGSDRGLYKRSVKLGWDRAFEAILLARKWMD